MARTVGVNSKVARYYIRAAETSQAVWDVLKSISDDEAQGYKRLPDLRIELYMALQKYAPSEFRSIEKLQPSPDDTRVAATYAALEIGKSLRHPRPQREMQTLAVVEEKRVVVSPIVAGPVVAEATAAGASSTNAPQELSELSKEQQVVLTKLRAKLRRFAEVQQRVKNARDELSLLMDEIVNFADVHCILQGPAPSDFFRSHTGIVAVGPKEFVIRKFVTYLPTKGRQLQIPPILTSLGIPPEQFTRVKLGVVFDRIRDGDPRSREALQLMLNQQLVEKRDRRDITVKGAKVDTKEDEEVTD